MGSRGPLPQPGSSESARGRNTLRRKGPARRAKPVQMPPAVKACAPAAAFWKLHAATLIASRRLRPELAHTFGLLCLLAADCDRYAASLAEEGDIVTTERGPQAHPAARLLRDARRDYVALARDFGLTAASDARIPAEADDEKQADPDEIALRAFTGRRA